MRNVSFSLAREHSENNNNNNNNNNTSTCTYIYNPTDAQSYLAVKAFLSVLILFLFLPPSSLPIRERDVYSTVDRSSLGNQNSTSSTKPKVGDVYVART